MKRVVERWKVIEDFPDYAVSSFGRVKRLTYAWKSRTYPGFILKFYKNNRGYLYVELYGKKRYVHHLVLRAFVGGKKRGMECNHKDGNKENNNRLNLEWVTRSENLRHAIETGLADSGADRSDASLKQKQVDQIRNFYETGLHSIYKLADMFNVGKSTIHRVVTWRTYR